VSANDVTREHARLNKALRDESEQAEAGSAKPRSKPKRPGK
jgi:hypothetical protein